MKLIWGDVARRLTISLAVLCSLGGCVAYGTSPAYYDPGPAVYVAPPVYAPVYVEPGYYGPPVFFNFGFRSGGYHGYRGYRGYHGYRGGGHGYRR